jgi:hypothetical protein
MSYRAIVLPAFGTFVLSRRLDSMMIYVKKNNYDKVYSMLKEVYENLELATDSDIKGQHRDAICGSIAVAMADIKGGYAPSDILSSYILDIIRYVDNLIAGFSIAYDELINKPSGRLDDLPIELRELIACEAY